MSYLSARDDQADERARLYAELDRRLASDGPLVEHDDLGSVFRTVRDATGANGRPPVPWVFEPGRDAAGRHLPAHLAVTLSRQNGGRGGTDAFYRPRTPTYEWSRSGRDWEDLCAPPGQGADRISDDPDGPMLGG